MCFLLSYFLEAIVWITFNPSNVWSSFPAKPFEARDAFFGCCYITNSISSIVISLVRLSIPYCMAYDSLYFFKELVHVASFVKFTCVELFIEFSYYLWISTGSVVIAPVAFLILVICVFFLSFFLSLRDFSILLIFSKNCSLFH